MRGEAEGKRKKSGNFRETAAIPRFVIEELKKISYNISEDRAGDGRTRAAARSEYSDNDDESITNPEGSKSNGEII